MVKFSNIIADGKIIPFQEWDTHIDKLRAETEILPKISDESKAIEEITKHIKQAINKRIPNRKFGIFFSGGVDSTLIAFICSKITDNFTCYTVGMDGSRDLEESTKTAKKLNLRHIKRKLSINEVEPLFEETARLIGKDLVNIVNLGVGTVVLAAIELAKKDKVRIFFSGLGSEEVFAGYQRHEKAQDINEECWTGLKTTWDRDFQRDTKIALSTNIDVLTPFLDRDIIITGMRIDGKLKIKKGQKKYILRKAAEHLGMPEEIAFRPKIAAQYGSNFDKAISKIAKSKGFRYKKEYMDYLIKKI